MLAGCILYFAQLNARAGRNHYRVTAVATLPGFFVLFLVGFFAPFSRLLRNAGSSETNTDPYQLVSISLHAFSDTEIVIECIWAIQTNCIHTKLWLKTKIIRFGWQIIIIKLSSRAFASCTFVTILFLKDYQEGQQANILMYYDMCTRISDWQQMNCNLLSGHMLHYCG